MANPGPASVTTLNTQLTATNQTFTANPTLPVMANALRLLASARGMSVGSTGDAAVCPVNLVGTFSVLYVIVTNAQVSGASGSIATAAFGVFTASAGGGTAIVANAANTTNTGYSNGLFGTATPNLYVNVGTALANGTCDVFIYGYDLT
jgi:hypothetical protein